MRIISTKVHGALDYLVGFFLIGTPWLLNFAKNGLETWTPVILGVAAIVYSLFTNYEFGVSKALSIRMHLFLDILSGILLASSPWILGFNDYIYLPHLILGLLEIAVSVLTDPIPGPTENTTSERRHQQHLHAH